ncbi:hypothetical protein LFL96_00995 [Paraburkholderia sp. D15]|uniref:hypothetical protein n=1 Tax=Paraburkholderia sp. D15 TaxID=2880218 RepID=UPI00247A039F|nr:hypothetical protein [Paraburkholderia sp. D15]WGS50118.1 hypothetical protein LFL96_00995 [Paraburkholderia sp. D15]
MHNLDKILDHLEKCKPYAPQNPVVVRRITFTGWALFLIGAAALFAVKITVTTRPLSGLNRAVADGAVIGVVLGSALLFLAFIAQFVVGVQTTLRERAESNPRTTAQRRLEVDENNVRFLLDQPDRSLEYAQCYLRQMNSRTGEWIAHVFGSAAPVLPLLAVLLAVSRELGVTHWLEDAFAQGHPANPLVLRLIFFAIALAVLTVATAFGLAAEQRKNSYRLGLIEMAITLKNMMDKPVRGRKRGGAR